MDSSLARRDTAPPRRPRTMEQPASGHHRIACGEPGQAVWDGRRREGLVWNLSTVGLYLVLAPPLPPAEGAVQVTFTLPGDPAAMTVQGRVRWLNPPSIFKGCGGVKLSIPPGCGVEFVALEARDAQRIAARVRATVASAR